MEYVTSIFAIMVNRESTRGEFILDAVAKVKLVFYALLICLINLCAFYYAVFYDDKDGSGIFANKGQYSFGESASAADQEIPVTLSITDQDDAPIGNLEVIVKSVSNGNASFPQKTNEKGIVQWTASQGLYTVEIYMNHQVIKKKIVVIDHKNNQPSN